MHVYSYSSCNHKPEIVFSFDGVDYYAADAKGVEDFDGDFVINFTRTRNTPDNTGKYSQLRKYFEVSFEELQVPWPDFGTPKIKIGFWSALHKFIKKNKWKSVCFHCQGGHGRTGTALAAMLIANAGYTPNESVEWVRETHCDEAVESRSQAEYLFDVDKHYNKRELVNDITPSYSSKAVSGFYNKYGSGWSGGSSGVSGGSAPKSQQSVGEKEEEDIYASEYRRYVEWWDQNEDCESPYHAKGMVDVSGVEDDEKEEEDEFNYNFVDDEPDEEEYGRIPELEAEIDTDFDDDDD